jgi:hypothetical protein
MCIVFRSGVGFVLVNSNQTNNNDRKPLISDLLKQDTFQQRTKMQLEELPTELLLAIFGSSMSLRDVLSLALTCRRFRDICRGPLKLAIYANAVEAEYGPVDDAVRLVTYNDSQPAYVRRDVPMSLALLKQVVAVGRVARKWQEEYQHEKWYDEDRRLLTADEAYRIRRAIYRLWLYGKAFHNGRHFHMSRVHGPPVIGERLRLLHDWTNEELFEMSDVFSIMEVVVGTHVCPSDAEVRRKFSQRFPHELQPLAFAGSQNSPFPAPPPALPPVVYQDLFHTTHRWTPAAVTHTHNYMPAAQYAHEGWGDYFTHPHVVTDMMKLDPAQIIWLREHAPLKRHVQWFVRSLGDWFFNNGETFTSALQTVLQDRGLDPHECKESVDMAEMGIVKRPLYTLLGFPFK